MSCVACTSHKRAYPCQVRLDNKAPLLGTICLVCNRKFLMMETYVKLIKPCEETDEQVFFVMQSLRSRIEQASQLRL